MRYDTLNDTLNDCTDERLYDRYTSLKKARQNTSSAFFRSVLTDELLRVKLEILKRSKGKTHFAGHELAVRS